MPPLYTNQLVHFPPSRFIVLFAVPDHLPYELMKMPHEKLHICQSFILVLLCQIFSSHLPDEASDLGTAVLPAAAVNEVAPDILPLAVVALTAVALPAAAAAFKLLLLQILYHPFLHVPPFL